VGSDETVARLAKSLGRYQAAVVGGLAFIVVFAITVMGIMLWQSYRLGQEAEKVQHVATTTRGALCALRQDVKTRRDANLKLLRDHPEDPVLAFGLEIPRDTLLQSAAGQTSTLKALVTLDCRP
jgi:hypothetical protein